MIVRDNGIREPIGSGGCHSSTHGESVGAKQPFSRPRGIFELRPPYPSPGRVLVRVVPHAGTPNISATGRHSVGSRIDRRDRRVAALLSYKRRQSGTSGG